MSCVVMKVLFTVRIVMIQRSSSVGAKNASDREQAPAAGDEPGTPQAQCRMADTVDQRAQSGRSQPGTAGTANTQNMSSGRPFSR